MKRNLSGDDRHFDQWSGANRDKHINFPGAKKENSENSVTNKDASDRQQQRQQEIGEGEREKRSNDDSSTPMDNEDTIGVP